MSPFPARWRMVPALAAAILMLPAAGPAFEWNLPRVLVGRVEDYAVRQGDTLSSIGARAGVDVATLAADNGLAAGARVVAGQSLRIDNRHIVPAGVDAGALIVNVPQRMLFRGAADGSVESYPVA